MNKIKKLAITACSHLSACLSPVIPIIIAASFIKLAYLILTSFSLIGGSTQVILNALGDVPFYFLPVTVGYSASKHFKTDPFYSIALGCVMLAPDLVALLAGTEPVTFFGLPIMRNSYAYNVLPIILTVYLVSIILPKVENKFSPALKSTLLPFLFFTSMSVIELFLIAPIGSLIGLALSKIFAWGSIHAAVITWGVLGALFIFLVPTGVHWIFVTTAITDLSTKGFDIGIQAAFMIMVTALAGVDLGCAIRSKTAKDRAIYISYTIGALTSGVSEPSIYNVAFRDGRALKAGIIGCIIPGIFQGLFGIKCFIYSFPAVSSLLIFYSPEEPGYLINAIIAAVLAFGIGLIMTLLFIKEAQPAPTGTEE